MEEQKKSTGGRPAGPGGTKKAHSVRVTADVKEFLNTINSSVFLEILIRDSEAFKQWQSQR